MSGPGHRLPFDPFDQLTDFAKAQGLRLPCAALFGVVERRAVSTSVTLPDHGAPLILTPDS